MPRRAASTQARIAELEKQQAEAEAERRREAARLEEAQARNDWSRPANWPALLVHRLPLLLGGKGLGLAVSVLLLKPCQRILCTNEAVLSQALASAWGAWVWEASCGPAGPAEAS